MRNIVVLSALLAVAQADVNEYLGTGITIASFPSTTEYPMECSSYTVSKVNAVQCTCGDKTNMPLTFYKFADSKSSEYFAAVDLVNSYAEVQEAIKIKKCKCGDKEYQHGAFREINDNFFIHYTATESSSEPNIAYISVKTLPTKAVFEDTIKSIPDLSSRTNFVLFCDLK